MVVPGVGGRRNVKWVSEVAGLRLSGLHGLPGAVCLCFPRAHQAFLMTCSPFSTPPSLHLQLSKITVGGQELAEPGTGQQAPAVCACETGK